MPNDSYDEGLVHSHAWATEPVRAPRPAPKQPAAVRRAEEDFDDGLVHGHGWAVRDRAR